MDSYCTLRMKVLFFLSLWYHKGSKLLCIVFFTPWFSDSPKNNLAVLLLLSRCYCFPPCGMSTEGVDMWISVNMKFGEFLSHHFQYLFSHSLSFFFFFDHLSHIPYFVSKISDHQQVSFFWQSHNHPNIRLFCLYIFCSLHLSTLGW